MGVPQNGWFIRENPIEMDDLGVPLFTPLRVGGPPTPQVFFGQLKHIYKKSFKNIVFFSVFTMCSVENTVIYAVFGIKSVQNSGFCSVFRLWHQKKFNAVISPNPWKHRYLHCFLQFFHVPMPLASSNIYTKSPSKTLFFSVFLHFFRQERRNLHVFRLKVGPKHWFLQCFQCSGIQKPFKISLFTVFFHFCPFFPCRKPTKMTQNSVSIPS